MQVADLERLFDYSYWANGKLLAALAQLSPEQFVMPVAGSYGSIRNTLVHAMSAEWGWLDRCGGPARGPALEAERYPTIEALSEAWDRVEGHMRTFLAGLRDADLSRRIVFTLGRGPAQERALGDLLQHAAFHGVHHRAQVALLMRELGFGAGNFDYLIYLANAPVSPPTPAIVTAPPDVAPQGAGG